MDKPKQQVSNLSSTKEPRKESLIMEVTKRTARSRFLNSISEDRIDVLGKKILSKKEYKSISSACRKIYKLLKSTLSEEQKKLIDRLDEEHGRMLALYENFYYLSGLIDGCSLGTAISKNISEMKEGKSL